MDGRVSDSFWLPDRVRVHGSYSKSVLNCWMLCLATSCMLGECRGGDSRREIGTGTGLISLVGLDGADVEHRPLSTVSEDGEHDDTLLPRPKLCKELNPNSEHLA